MKTPHRSPVVELGLDDDFARDKMQSPGEAQHGGDLGAPLSSVLGGCVCELVLDGHRQ